MPRCDWCAKHTKDENGLRAYDMTGDMIDRLFSTRLKIRPGFWCSSVCRERSFEFGVMNYSTITFWDHVRDDFEVWWKNVDPDAPF